MELAEKLPQFEARGLKVAAITYDTAAVLKHFAARKGIAYPLLSDEGSKVIRSFNILNDTIAPDNQFHGIPFPGTYVLDEKGIVKSKHFEADYRERFTGGGILLRDFDLAPGGGQVVATEHLKLRVTASNDVVYPGQKVMLILEGELKPKLHVYAPGVAGDFIPVEWKLAASPLWRAFDIQHPPSRRLRWKGVSAGLPVFEKKFRLTREVTIGQARALGAALAEGKLKIEGSFRYQACDDKVCFPPRAVPLEWRFELRKFDSERVPLELRGKSRL